MYLSLCSYAFVLYQYIYQLQVGFIPSSFKIGDQIMVSYGEHYWKAKQQAGQRVRFETDSEHAEEAEYYDDDLEDAGDDEDKAGDGKKDDEDAGERSDTDDNQVVTRRMASMPLKHGINIPQ